MNLDGTFDLATARVCLAACAETYRSPETSAFSVGQASCLSPLFSTDRQDACPTVERVQTALAHACVIRQADCVIVAFRGSVSLRDWLTDFEFRRVQVGPDRIHEGFWRAWQSVEEQVEAIVLQVAGCPPSLRYGAASKLQVEQTAVAAIENLQPSTFNLQPIFVTGHSLGGAMALLAAEALFKAGYPVAAVYTFGGPRVGNGAWAEGYDLLLRRCTWRLVDELDIVPRVPVLGYRHAGHRVQICSPLPSPFSKALDHDLALALSVQRLSKSKEQEQEQVQIDPPLWRTLAADALGVYRAYRARRLAQLTDHPLAAYQSRLAQAIAPGTYGTHGTQAASPPAAQ